MKYLILSLVFTIVLVSCAKPEARKPVVRKTSSFMSESIERNKLLNRAENALLLQKMKADSLNAYESSEYGFWYYYNVKMDTEAYEIKSGDVVFYAHEIRSLDETILYSRDDLGTKSYLVDKEELIAGLQDGFKLMKEGETVTFLFPSYKAYGYTGNDKINPNQPLMYTVQLLKINKLSENANN